MQFVARCAAKYRDYPIALRNKVQTIAAVRLALTKIFPKALQTTLGFREEGTR
jgi:hypothetical protein